jgi:hypothetical protein
MNIKVIKFSSLLSLGLVLIHIAIGFPDLSLGLGLLLGSLASISGYIILDLQISRVRTTKLKRALVFNRLARYLMYILVFLISYFNQEIFNVITTIIGLFVIKLSLLIMFSRSSKKNIGKRQ